MMSELSDNQEKLKVITTKAIDELTDKNEKLISQQKQMLQVSDAHRCV